jgi:hypothetical protein
MGRYTKYVASCFLLSVLLMLISSATPGSPADSPPGRTAYTWQPPCNSIGRNPSGWDPEDPRRATGLFDVYWGSNEDGPTEGQRDAILGVGGQIVYEFHVPAVRARLRVSAVPTIGAGRVESVEDPTHHIVRVDVNFSTPISELDQEFLESLGATIVVVSSAYHFLLLAVPDESIPEIRAHPGVAGVFFADIEGCGAGGLHGAGRIDAIEPAPAGTGQLSRGPRSVECRAAQRDVQTAVGLGGPYKNHGQLVQKAASLVTSAEEAQRITSDCGECIITQFAKSVPIDQQEPCGPDPDPCGGCPDGSCVFCSGGWTCLGNDEGCTGGIMGASRPPGAVSDAEGLTGQAALPTLAISPNPLRVSSEWTVSFSLPSSDAARVEIFDVASRRVLAKDIGRGVTRRSVTLNAPADLPSGVYFVRLVQGRKAWTKTAVVLR